MLEDMLKKEMKVSDNTVHFEDLWEKTEAVASLEFKDEAEVLARLASNVSELKDIYRVSVNSNDKNLIKGVKSKAIGRLLYALTALSSKEEIDVYAALKDQWDISEFKEKMGPLE
jgi:hypothetical protein